MVATKYQGAGEGLQRIGLGALSSFAPILGAAFGIGDMLLGKSKIQRQREAEVDQALGQNASQYASLKQQQQLLPANARQKRMYIQEGTSTINALAGLGAGTGMGKTHGSDVSFAAGQGANIAKATTGAAMQKGASLAGTIGEQEAQQGYLNNAITENIGQRGTLSQYTDYLNDEGPQYLKSAIGGISALADIGGLVAPGNDNTNNGEQSSTDGTTNTLNPNTTVNINKTNNTAPITLKKQKKPIRGQSYTYPSSALGNYNYTVPLER